MSFESIAAGGRLGRKTEDGGRWSVVGGRWSVVGGSDPPVANRFLPIRTVQFQ